MEDDIFLKELGKKIADIRKAQGFTQEKFAEKLDIQRTSLTRIEIGGTNCSITLLRNISNELNLTLSELFEGFGK